jgi:multiple sugar transport system substrate-binding protein
MSTRRFFGMLTLLVLLITPAILFANGATEESTESAEPVTVTLWKWGGVDKTNIQLGEYAQVNPELFEDIEVEVVTAGGNDHEVNRAFRLALAAGTDVPDMVTMNYNALPEFATAGVLTDLSEYLAPYEADISIAGLDLTRYNGQVVAIPKQAKPKLWFYRKDMFAEAGIVPEEIRTADDFLAAAQQFHDTFPDSYILNLGPQPIHYWYFNGFASWKDSRVATEDGEYQLTSHPSFAAWLQFTKDLFDSGLTYRTDDFSSDWNQGFIDDKIGSWLGLSWGWKYPGSRWQETPDPEKWGVTLWPEFVRTGSGGGGGIIVIPKDAPNVEAAARYAVEQFLTTEGSVSYFHSTGVAPVTISGMEQLSREVENPPEDLSAKALEVLDYWGDTFPTMTAESYKYFHNYNYDPSASAELEIFRQHTESLLAGRHATVQDALAAAQADMESQIGNPYEF